MTPEHFAFLKRHQPLSRYCSRSRSSRPQSLALATSKPSHCLEYSGVSTFGLHSPDSLNLRAPLAARPFMNRPNSCRLIFTSNANGSYYNRIQLVNNAWLSSPFFAKQFSTCGEGGFVTLSSTVSFHESLKSKITSRCFISPKKTSSCTSSLGSLKPTMKYSGLV